MLIEAIENSIHVSWKYASVYSSRCIEVEFATTTYTIRKGIDVMETVPAAASRVSGTQHNGFVWHKDLLTLHIDSLRNSPRNWYLLHNHTHNSPLAKAAHRPNRRHLSLARHCLLHRLHQSLHRRVPGLWARCRRWHGKDSPICNTPRRCKIYACLPVCLPNLILGDPLDDQVELVVLV